jgi:hypothetical protein
VSERNAPVTQADPAVFAAMQRETERQEYNLELIAFENVVSETVLEHVGDDVALARVGHDVRALCARFPIYHHRLG